MGDNATTEEAPPGRETQQGAPGVSLEEMQARHRRERRELQGRVTGKKKGATKKTRRAVNDECADMERRLAERQEGEVASLLGAGGGPGGDGDDGDGGEDGEDGVGDVVEGVGEVRLEEEPVPQAQSQSQSQVPGKKRNRQKERLARRQAEQLAAAEAAEDEASGMVDHRAAEREAMASTFKANSLAEREIRPDGHCLFSAVADQLQHRGMSLIAPGLGGAAGGGGGGGGQEIPGYKAVRGVAAGWIRDHGDDFAPFLEEDLGSYVAKMRDTAEWGGQVELQALAAAYNLEINVVQNGPTETIRAGGDGGGDAAGAEKIWLAYYRHGYGLGEHYNSLRTALS